MAIGDLLKRGGEFLDARITDLQELVAAHETLEEQNDRRGGNPGQQGVFGLHPLATPKYALNERNGTPRDNEFKDSLARMYISLADADDETRKAYLASLPDKQTKELAKVLLGKGQGSGAGFVDFFLQQVQESFQEVVQVDKVLGDNYVGFYFGQEPPVFQYSGSLLNSQQDDQRTGFALAYQYLIRGTQLARRGTLLRLRYDSVIVSGTVNHMTQAINAENEMIVPFSFSLLVKEYVIYQRTKYTKMSASQYLQLATDFSTKKLSDVGLVDDSRIHAAMIEPSDVDEDQIGTITSHTTPQGALIDKAKKTAEENRAEEEKEKGIVQEDIDRIRKQLPVDAENERKRQLDAERRMYRSRRI